MATTDSPEHTETTTHETLATQSLATHRVVWAAERARNTGTVVPLPA